MAGKSSQLYGNTFKIEEQPYTRGGHSCTLYLEPLKISQNFYELGMEDFHWKLVRLWQENSKIFIGGHGGSFGGGEDFGKLFIESGPGIW